MSISGDDEIIDVLSTTIFIGIYDKGKKYISIIRGKLNPQSVAILDETIKNWELVNKLN